MCLKTRFFFCSEVEDFWKNLMVSCPWLFIHCLFLSMRVIFTAFLHHYMLLASVQAFALLSFGDSLTEKWTFISGGSEHEYSRARLLLLWKTSYMGRELRGGNLPWGSSHSPFTSVLYIPMVNATGLRRSLLHEHGISFG